jgi:hypothetical protein
MPEELIHSLRQPLVRVTPLFNFVIDKIRSNFKIGGKSIWACGLKMLVLQIRPKWGDILFQGGSGRPQGASE